MNQHILGPIHARQLENAKAVRARLFNAPTPHPQISHIPKIKRIPAISCRWALKPLNFGEHVITYRQWKAHVANQNLSAKSIPLRRIVADFKAVCPIPWIDLCSERRTVKIVRWRQALFYAIRDYTTLSFPQIGRQLGGRDHTTIIHGCSRVEEAIESGNVTSHTSATGLVFHVRNLPTKEAQ